ncbi:MAG: squalene/phytoene synthase family protein [Cyanobacteria bacterium J06554_6]
MTAYDRTFYVGSLLLPRSQRQAMWAIYAWFRQKDEVIDGPGNLSMKQTLLDEWFEQLQDLFSLSQPAVPTDIALIEAVQRYRIPIALFQDMLRGQQMDLDLNRYPTWEDLRLYCYCVAGTVGAASAFVLNLGHVQTWSFSGEECSRFQLGRGTGAVEAANGLITLGIAMQLTNILQDVGADARRGRIYLPLADLKRFDYSEQQLFDAVVDRRWNALMDYEIQRARSLYDRAEQQMSRLPHDCRWSLEAALIRYRQDLQAIEKRAYQVFSDRPHVPIWWKARALGVAWWRSVTSASIC